MEEDFCDADQEAAKINCMVAPTPQILIELKHAKTSKETEEKKMKALERSQTTPTQKKREIHATDITENELDTFSSIFKNRLKFSSFLKEQFNIIASLPPIPPEMIEALALKLPSKKKKLTNKTLVFDLDNTLVYTMWNKTPEKYKGQRASYIINSTGKSFNINVVIRPYAIEMLKQLSPYYEIIVFTAAIKSYGNAIISLLDPDGTLIDHFLYREHCIKIDNVHIKDLRILNRDLSSVIIIDNNLTSFCNQIENGILVSSFSGARADSELVGLWIFLRQSTSVEDVRLSIASKYSLKLLYQLHKRIEGQ